GNVDLNNVTKVGLPPQSHGFYQVLTGPVLFESVRSSQRQSGRLFRGVQRQGHQRHHPGLVLLVWKKSGEVGEAGLPVVLKHGRILPEVGSYPQGVWAAIFAENPLDRLHSKVHR
ncbi:MAG: hypothetical protein RIR28_406, partial [Pseudomonadota bacterium]